MSEYASGVAIDSSPRNDESKGLGTWLRRLDGWIEGGARPEMSQARAVTFVIEHADLHRERVAGEFLALMDLFVRGEGAMTDGSGLPAEARERLVPALLARSDISVLMARGGDEAVGFAVCIEGFSTFAARPVLNLHDMMVHPDHRRIGVGRALLAAVETLAGELGCCKLTLEVLSGNHGAQALYRSFGFRGYTLDPERGTGLFWEKPLDGA